MYSKRHHYVPETLMKPWLLPRNIMRGYYWDSRKEAMRYHEKGAKGFCAEEHLLTIEARDAPPDRIERETFGPVDARGARARDKLIRDGRSTLDADEKRDFISLLVSLDARRPEVVKKLREGGEYLRQGLNADPEARALATMFGLTQKPSEFWEAHRGTRLEDRALGMIERITASERVADHVARANWVVRKLSSNAPEVVLPDRPLVRVGSTFSADFIWSLPLAPNVVFFATPDAVVADKIRRVGEKALVHEVNAAGVAQSDRYIFSTVEHGENGWLFKRLRARFVASRSGN